MKKNTNMLHTVYMMVSPVIIIVLLILTILYWKQKKDCKTKEGMCLCGGPQLTPQCRPYNFNGERGLNVNSPRREGPSELKMRYDQRWTGPARDVRMPYANGAC